MLKLLRSSAILGSDSAQSNNKKDHSLWVTLFIPRERPNVKHAIAEGRGGFLICQKCATFSNIIGGTTDERSVSVLDGGPC